MCAGQKSGKKCSGDWNHCRWCEDCDQHHGFLYQCPYYSNDVKLAISIEDGTVPRLACLGIKLHPIPITEFYTNTYRRSNNGRDVG